jgi:hypothetical protein
VGTVGDSNIIHVSNSRPFWNKCLFRSMVWHSPTYSNDDILPTTIHQEPTGPPSFLAVNLEAKRFTLVGILENNHPIKYI